MICWGWVVIESSTGRSLICYVRFSTFVCNILLKISCKSRCVHVNVTQALFYYRWMMLHKYILNLDLCKKITSILIHFIRSFNHTMLNTSWTFTLKLELSEHCIISRCFTLASKIFHSQYFNRVYQIFQ